MYVRLRSRDSPSRHELRRQSGFLPHKARVALVSELLGAIRYVKTVAWEPPFAAAIARARERELAVMRARAAPGAALVASFNLVPSLMAVALLMARARMGASMAPSIIFPGARRGNETRALAPSPSRLRVCTS